jgi:mono/diheme cytochrome c family protein
VFVLVMFAVNGCKRDDMAEQPKMKPYQPAIMFADKTEARPLVAGTVARPAGDVPGIPYAVVWAPGPVGASDAPGSRSIPVPITQQLIQRGQQRFNIYCAVCHGRLGDGNGMIVQRGMIRPPSFHNDRLADAAQSPDSHFYDVISNGRGAMFSYAERVAPADRWAIIAYIRTLQESVREAAKDGRLTAAQYTALKGARP